MCLHSVGGLLDCLMGTQLRSCDKDHMIYKASTINYLAYYRNSLQTFAPNGPRNTDFGTHR